MCTGTTLRARTHIDLPHKTDAIHPGIVTVRHQSLWVTNYTNSNELTRINRRHLSKFV